MTLVTPNRNYRFQLDEHDFDGEIIDRLRDQGMSLQQISASMQGAIGRRIEAQLLWEEEQDNL